jgi:hypothetical protein
MAGEYCAARTAARMRDYIFLPPSPSPQVLHEPRGEIQSELAETVYAAVWADPLVRQDFAAAITALSSLSVSPARKPRIRRND